MKLIGAGAFIIRIMYFTHHQHRKSKHANHGKPVPDLYTGKDIAGNNYTDRRARQSFKISMDRSHFHIETRQTERAERTEECAGINPNAPVPAADKNTSMPRQRHRKKYHQIENPVLPHRTCSPKCTGHPAVKSISYHSNQYAD